MDFEETRRGDAYADALSALLSGLKEENQLPASTRKDDLYDLLEDGETYQNPFQGVTDYKEAHKILLRELEITKTRGRFVCLQADYIDVLPALLWKDELEALRKELKRRRK